MCIIQACLGKSYFDFFLLFNVALFLAIVEGCRIYSFFVLSE